ncbi:MAG: magnesium transporter [Eubacteriales bacterium]|jgi:magnesium transporter|nr:magnesium transporter [Bacillota bacterium]MBV1726791.1 magnesium transporter [Desulforudis sp.]MDZ4043003.1 magnesium transporter [Eubacteriales bacterium]MBU4554254.1 magnesium transporter [Bacillota bacterium]MBV1735810.1 magnesium transporter [Desulforudis sp.]
MAAVYEVQETISGFLAGDALEQLAGYLADVHYADLAEALVAFDLDQQLTIFRIIDNAKAAQVLFELEREQIAPLIKGLGKQHLAQIFREMSTDDAADLIGDLPDDKQEHYLSLMSRSDAEDVQELLEYGEDTAGGIMATEFVAINKEITIEEAIEVLRRTARQAETVYYVYVVNDQEQLVGVISLRELITAPPGTRIREVMRTTVISVNVHTDQEEVARVVQKYNFLVIPVVDDIGVLLGIVTVDDVLDVIEAEATEDFLSLANVHREGQYLEMNDIQRAVLRLPWLIALLFGALLAGSVIQFFEGTLESVVALAFFLPVMAGGPGNVATQTLAVVVRGLATGEVASHQAVMVMLREMRVGLIVGVVCGSVLALIAFVWQGSATLGVVVGLSLACSMILATALGSLCPLIINRIGIDPALASGPFITTLMDVTSMLIYFSVASVLLLNYLR